MLFLMDSFSAPTDDNGNPRKLIMVTCVLDDAVTNVVWADVSYSGIPSNLKQLFEVISGLGEITKADKLNHVQHLDVDGETWNDLFTNVAVGS